MFAKSKTSIVFLNITYFTLCNQYIATKGSQNFLVLSVVFRHYTYFLRKIVFLCAFANVKTQTSRLQSIQLALFQCLRKIKYSAHVSHFSYKICYCKYKVQSPSNSGLNNIEKYRIVIWSSIPILFFY